MYINIRTFDGKNNVVVTVSKTLSIEDLKLKIFSAMGVEVDRQRLFYRGKQLVDGHTLFDYNINLNDVVQLMGKDFSQDIKKSNKPPLCKNDTAVSNLTEENDSNQGDHVEKSIPDCTENCNNGGVNVESQYFKIGDMVDVKDVNNGTWLEGKVISISAKNSDIYNIKEMNDGLKYSVLLDTNEEIEEILINVRPRARHLIRCTSLKEGDEIFANFNLDKPNERGHWYQCTVSKLGKINHKVSEVYVNIYLGQNPLIKNAKLKFYNEIFKLEEWKLRSDIDDEEYQQPVPKRKTMPSCASCSDRLSVKCKDCGCHVCGMKNDPNKQIMCDECDMAFHLQCLKPPLDSIPSDNEWFCPECKNDENEIVRPGEKLKRSKKKEKMASASNSSTRDWGKGMACVGRTKECTLVPSNHFGPIPGVEVGTCWKYRLQVSEAGVHRPHVAGIHGRESDGAYSIVLSGGYEDDVDSGETFLYTGSGGRDLSGNKRTAEQSCDQTLTRMNKALALNCDAPLSNAGGKAKNWKKGKPIRVVRNYKAAKHSKFAPEDGNRYDGIYKVAEYYPQKGKSGFIVWRYVLKRDDPSPAPWTKEGKEYIKKFGLVMLYPDGYLEAEAAKLAQEIEKINKQETSKQEKGKKRTSDKKQLTLFETKRLKLEEYTLEEEVKKAIEGDQENEKLWNTCKSTIKEGKQKFLSVVSETFVCICCQEVVYEPVSTPCKHNFCLSCLKRAFKAEVYSCPACRTELSQNFEMKTNTHLGACLLKLFPGYGFGR